MQSTHVTIAGGFQSLKCSKNCLHLLTTSVARVRTVLIADGHPTRKWEYKHYCWVDDHPLLHGKTNIIQL